MAESSTLHRAPRRFRPAGVVKQAKMLEGPPPFTYKDRRTHAQMRGIRYEAKVHLAMTERYGDAYIPSQWFSFVSDYKTRWCQTDGLLIDPWTGQIIIIEVKYSHIADAWWQLFMLYLPVVRQIFGAEWTFSCCEVVKWYDPAVQCPQPPILKREIEMTRPAEWGVHIWSPRA